MRYIDLKVISSDIVHIKGLNLNPVPITSGSVNDIFCRFEFSHHWDGITFKTAVFSGSGQTKAVIIENGLAAVPWECISLPYGELRVGVVGTTAENEGDNSCRIFTSEEICIGTVALGTDADASLSGEPSPSLAEQLLLKFEWVEEGENDRVESEEKRKSAEKERLENELLRVENEKVRQQNELERTEKDSSREQAVTALNTRISAIEKKVDTIPDIPKADSVFKNNSWETISKIARYGDPSKYWKVGDYKEINIPYFNIDLGSVAGVTFFNRDRFLELIDFEPGSYEIIVTHENNRNSTAQIYGPNGFSFNDRNNTIELVCADNYDDAYISDLTVSKTIKKVPVQIIGFNHDDVTSPSVYGKAKAGLTLMLGCTQGYYGNKIGVYEGNIPHCSVSMSDNHIISPNTLDTNGVITQIGSNWSQSAFRNYMAKHLDLFLPEEITQKAVTVNKLSSNKFSAKNFYREFRTTSDKYFLLSEYELYGEQINTKANEGEQYALFKKGSSKLILTPEILNAVQGNATDTHTNSRFWLRSVDSKYTDPYIPSTNFYSPTSGYTSNPNYTNNGFNVRTNSLLMSYNRDTEIYNYVTGGAFSNSVPAYVAPCFCL